jgi:DNA processing protein
MSAGTIVIEAGEKSGALITVRYALEENREVFAVPGSIYAPTSMEPNNLIKLGAKAVTTAEDVLNSLGLADRRIQNNVKKTLPATPEEEIILQALSDEPRHLNLLAKATKLDINLINSRLTIMEMKGTVKNLGNLTYIKKRV